MLIFQCCEFDNRVRVCAVSLCGVLTGQIWLLVSISLCGFNLTLQLVWMLRGNPFLLETFPLDLPQHIVCAPSALSNYSLGGAGGFFGGGLCIGIYFHFWQSLETNQMLLFLFCFAARITHWHIARCSQRGWTAVEPGSTGEEAQENEKPLKRAVIFFI